MLVGHILPLLPPHTRYVEVFGGGLAVLIAKKPSKIEVANDKNKLLMTFWRVLRDPETSERLRQALEYTPYARQEYEHCQATWQDESLEPVERVRRWYVATQQCFTHEETRNSGWRRPYAHGADHRSENNIWVNRVDRLQEVAHRLRRVALECLSFEELIPYYNDPETLLFIDPPYLPASRTERDNYQHEMSQQQHRELLDMVNSTKSQVIVTGYSSQMYEQALQSPAWQRHAVTRASQIHNNAQAGRAGKRTEMIWVKQHMSPTLFLFDMGKDGYS